eukprot:8072400-Pyramimonas_sp.AAC.2
MMPVSDQVRCHQYITERRYAGTPCTTLLSPYMHAQLVHEFVTHARLSPTAPRRVDVRARGARSVLSCGLPQEKEAEEAGDQEGEGGRGGGRGGGGGGEEGDEDEDEDEDAVEDDEDTTLS